MSSTTKLSESVVVVSGLPRSGTSMMMKMLEAGGLPVVTDQIRTADEDNPKGYYEFERVKQLPKGDTAWVEDANGRVVKVISALLQHLPEGHHYHVIFVRRHMEEILASQQKMLARRGEAGDRTADARMAQLFQKHVQMVEEWAEAQPHVEVTYLHYSDILADPVTAATQVNAFLGGSLDEEAMVTVVDPTLYRNRAE